MKTNLIKLNSFSEIPTFRTFISLVLFITLFTQNACAQDNAKANPSELLHSYLDIKNDLVSGNAADASLKATEFVKTLNGIDSKAMTPATHNALLKHATAIAEGKNITHQREDFATLSVNMFILAKTMKLSEQPLYYDYCSMKKAYWLSSESAIKNPYYGKMMLTCGQVTDTIK